MDAAALDAAVAVRQLPPGHVAAPGRGVFAASPLAARTPLLVYGGDVVRDEDAHASGFVFSLSATAGLACDATATPRCRAAYVNDARGSGLPHNCAFLELWCGGGCHARCAADAAAQPQAVHAHMVLCTLRAILPGEELLVSYGDSYWAPPNARSRLSTAFDSRLTNAAQCPPDAAPSMPAGAAAGTNIGALEGELLCRVFGYVTYAEDLAAVAAVQRSWRALLRATPALWRDVVFRPPLALAQRPARRALAIAANARGQLSTLDLRPLGDRGMLTRGRRDDGGSDSDDVVDEATAADEAAIVAAVAAEEEELEDEVCYDFCAHTRMHVRNSVRFRAALARIAAANPGLRHVAMSASAVHDDVWMTAAIRTGVPYPQDIVEPVWPTDCAWVHSFDGDHSLTVGAMWSPFCLAAQAQALPQQVALTADVSLNSDADVRKLLALHATRQLSLDALLLSLDEHESLEALAAALTAGGRLGLGLKHLVLYDSKSHHGRLYARVLSALADGGAPALHTLELRDCSNAVCTRDVAAFLRDGAAAFSLKRLAVLFWRAEAAALLVLADVLPATLHTLVLHVRFHRDNPGSTPQAMVDAVSTLLAAAAVRCPDLRSAQLRTNYCSDDFVGACQAAVDALSAARPDVRTSYRAFTVAPCMRARKSGTNLYPWWVR